MELDPKLLHRLRLRSPFRLWIFLMYIKLKIVKAIADDAAEIMIATAADLLRGRLVDRRAWVEFLGELAYLPLSIKIGLLHGVITFLLLLAFQVPVNELSPIVLPVMWAAAYCVTFCVWCLVESKPQKPPAHWISRSDWTDISGG